MKKRSIIQANKLTRFGALLMALAMVFTLSFTRLVNAEELPIEETLIEELVEEIEETPVAPAAAPAAPTAVAAPATPAAPAVPAPSVAVETPAASEALAEETQAPEETKQPAETQAPAEETEQTEAPQAPAEETQQPEETQTPAAETEQPEETQAPAEETEQPEETQAPVEGTEQPEETQAPVEESTAMEELTEEELGKLIAEIIDEQYPDRMIRIYISWGDKEFLEYGDMVYLTAELTGYNGLEYNLRWQRLGGNGEWQDIPGETGEKMILTLDEENSRWVVRVQVDITGLVQ